MTALQRFGSVHTPLHEEREEEKNLPKTCSSLSKPPYHRIKDYDRIDYLDFAQPKLYSVGGYTYYRVNNVLQLMIWDIKPTEDHTILLSSNDTGKTDSTIHCELISPLKKFPNHGNNNGKPHHMLTNSEVIIEKVHDNHEENGVTTLSQSVMGRNHDDRSREGRSPWLDVPILQTERRKILLDEAMEVCSDDGVANVTDPWFATTKCTWSYFLLQV